MTWLPDRLTDGRARVLGATIHEITGRWWISFQVDIDRAAPPAPRQQGTGPHAEAIGKPRQGRPPRRPPPPEGRRSAGRFPAQDHDEARGIQAGHRRGNPERHRNAHQPAAGASDLGPRVRRVLPPARQQGAWYGSSAWAADRWYPLSKLCGKCGVVNSSLTLAERVWPCTCGTVHDQDVNAARNLLAAMTLKQQAA